MLDRYWASEESREPMIGLFRKAKVIMMRSQKRHISKKEKGKKSSKRANPASPAQTPLSKIFAAKSKQQKKYRLS